MKAKEIRDLIDFISHSGLDEVNIETDEFKLSVRKSSWQNSAPAEVQSQPPAAKPQVNSNANEASSESIVEKTGGQQPAESDRYVAIKSPMIGTFYQAPNPESDPFIKVGDTVSVGQTVCIIEAMKLFNEVESEVSGKVIKIIVENASPVEYDQPLFLVDPA